MIDESISSLERRAEEESNYAKKLKSEFGKKTYFTLLKGYLLEIFTPAEIDFLSNNEYINYIVFSEQVQSELARGLKSMRAFVTEGEKQYLTTQMDEFTQTLNKIFDEGVKLGVSPILIEFALKGWLKLQISSKASIPIHRKVILSLQFFSKRELRKEVSKRKLVSVTEKALPMPASLGDVKLEGISDSIEDGDFFCDIAKIFADYFVTLPKIESIQYDYKDIKEKIKSTQDLIKKNASHKIEEIFGKVSDLSVNEISHNINEIIRYINSGEAKVRALSSQITKLKDASESNGTFNIPGILKFFDPNLTKKIKDNMDRSVVALSDKLGSVPDSFLSRGLLVRKTDFGSVIDWFIEKYNQVFVPTVVELIFEEMVRIFPESERSSIEEARWVGLLARKNDPPAVFFIPDLERTLSRKETIVRDCFETVSVMVYDIRGSSIMGEKLLNAEVEDKIRNEFQAELLKAVEDSRGFFVKDTGDGGIVLFSEESSDLYFGQVSMGGEDSKQSRGKEFKLKASTDSAGRAISCARSMIEYSERFVRKNLKRYKEWFKDFDEKSIDFGGITYERLPPEYRKIFQIGIGIASGKPGEDVYLGTNVLGRLDLTGSLVRRANMYSTVHHPDRSVILIGASTMFNFLLQVESFKSPDLGERIERSSYISMQKKLIEEVIRWMKGLSGNYIISGHKLALQRIDYLLGNSKGKGKVRIPEEGISLKKGMRFFDNKLDEEMVLYEVIPEKRG